MLHYTLVILLQFFVEVIVPSIVSKILATKPLNFFHLNFFLNFWLWETPFLLVSPWILELLTTPSIWFHFFFHFYLPLLFFKESSFIFLNHFTYKVCLDTFSKFLYFILNSYPSRDACSFWSFIFDKSLDSLMADQICMKSS